MSFDLSARGPWTLHYVVQQGTRDPALIPFRIFRLFLLIDETEYETSVVAASHSLMFMLLLEIVPSWPRRLSTYTISPTPPLPNPDGTDIPRPSDA
jgi:hypothetical protein